MEPDAKYTLVGAAVLVLVGLLVGAFVWFIKVQGALNRYWGSKAGAPAV